MMAAFGTLTFLATLWLLVVAGAAILEDSGAKIAAALKGQSFAAAPPRMAVLKIRAWPRVAQPIRVMPRLRDAA